MESLCLPSLLRTASHGTDLHFYHEMWFAFSCTFNHDVEVPIGFLLAKSTRKLKVGRIFFLKRETYSVTVIKAMHLLEENITYQSRLILVSGFLLPLLLVLTFNFRV